jgi:hypothetical protein
VREIDVAYAVCIVEGDEQRAVTDGNIAGHEIMIAESGR